MGDESVTMQFAYIAIDMPIAQLARLVHVTSAGAFEIQERDGLNIGGGQYFLIFDKDQELVLCWAENYADLPDARFKYCLYVWRGPDDLLERAAEQLSKQGAEVVIDWALAPGVYEGWPEDLKRMRRGLPPLGPPK